MNAHVCDHTYAGPPSRALGSSSILRQLGRGEKRLCKTAQGHLKQSRFTFTVLCTHRVPRNISCKQRVPALKVGGYGKALAVRAMHTHQGTTFHPKAQPLLCRYAFTYSRQEGKILLVKLNYPKSGSRSPTPVQSAFISDLKHVAYASQGEQLFADAKQARTVPQECTLCFQSNFLPASKYYLLRNQVLALEIKTYNLGQAQPICY